MPLTRKPLNGSPFPGLEKSRHLVFGYTEFRFPMEIGGNDRQQFTQRYERQYYEPQSGKRCHENKEEISMKQFLVLALSLALAMPLSATAAEDSVSALLVTGRGEVSAAPERATITFGAVAEAKAASEAQQEVNRIMNRAIAAVLEEGIAKKDVMTTSLQLTPVYNATDSSRQTSHRSAAPTIVAYRAVNSLEVRVRDLQRLGQVIDAAAESGINRIDNLIFELANPELQRKEALQAAVRDAQVKAEAMATALGVKLIAIDEVVEQGVGIFASDRRVMMTETLESAPVQPGEVRIEANVTVRYRIGPR